LSSASPPSLSIIVPTYNERDRLAELVSAIFAAYAAAGLDGQLIVVDDNSPDGTGALAEELAADRKISVVHRSGKLGLGTAVIAGFGVADAPVVGVMDADMSHPPGLVPRMFAVMQQADADVVVASRYIPGAGTRGWSVVRLLVSQLACLAARGLTPVRDATSGFFLIRKELAQGVRISAGGFKICLELLVRGRPSTVIEVPYVFEGRTAGESKMNAREALGYLVQLRDLYRFQRARPRFPQTYRRLSSEELRKAASVAR
jgi:dolichol-phosphate mannosyltransferase